MKALYLNPSDPEAFDIVQRLFTKHEDFRKVRDNDNGVSVYNDKLELCIVIDHPYSLVSCNPTAQ
jgi:hypothetical protein